MKSVGIMIRRRNRTNKKILDKEITTLHSKLKKKDTYPTLPSMKDDLYEMGKYYSTDYQYGEDRFSLYSIDGELFKGEFRDFEPQNFKSKCEEIIKRVVNLLK